MDVFADFLQYLFTCTRRYISETHGHGDTLWASFEDRIEFILSHPNGWEGFQQGKMRDAAIAAGLIPDTPAGRARVQFVTEGEASFNFCIRNGLADDVLQVCTLRAFAHVQQMISQCFAHDHSYSPGKES